MSFNDAILLRIYLDVKGLGRKSRHEAQDLRLKAVGALKEIPLGCD